MGGEVMRTQARCQRCSQGVGIELMAVVVLYKTANKYAARPALTLIVHSWLQAGLEAASLRPLQAPLDLEEHPPSSQVRARVLRHVVSLPSHIYPLPFHLVQPIKPLAISLRPHTVQ